MILNLEISKHHKLKKFFLALTALKEFWGGGEYQAVLAGPWCVRFSSTSQPKDALLPMLDDPWRDTATRRSEYDHSVKLREGYLRHLAEALNEIHGVNESLRYWRIMLMPWLIFYIETMIDRLAIIDAALDQIPGFATTGLREDCWITPSDCLEFPRLVVDDAYNLQLFSQILRTKNYPFNEISLAISPLPFGRTDQKSWIRKSIDGITRRLVSVTPRLLPWTGQVILRSSYLPRSVEWRFAAKSYGRIWPSLAPRLIPTKSFRDETQRKRIENMLPKGDGIRQILRDTIPLNIPHCFVEGYAEVKAAAKKWYSPTPLAIFSANSWYYDEPFKHAAGKSTNLGTLLLSCQHGSNYGCLEIMPSEDHERNIADVYYTWGWHEDKKCIAMPGTALVSLGASEQVAKLAKRILFVTTAEARYLLSFAHTPGQTASMLARQRRFSDALDPVLRAKIAVRHYPEDFGWDNRQRWQSFAPDIASDEFTKFTDSMSASDIVVIDHLGTTFLQAIATNKPCMIIIDPEFCILRINAQPWFDALEQAGVLFKSPESAARSLAGYAENLAEWWTDPERQNTISLFKKNFAHVQSNAAKDWYAEFMKYCLPDAPARASLN